MQQGGMLPIQSKRPRIGPAFFLSMLLLIVPFLACGVTNTNPNGGSGNGQPRTNPLSFSKPGQMSYTHSWYITDVADGVYNNIATLARRDAQIAKLSPMCSQGKIALTILDNGELLSDGSGTSNLGIHPWTYAQIQAGVERYISTWESIPVSCPLIVAVGLNNHVYDDCGDGCHVPLVAAGIAWATMVNALNTWVASSHFQTPITVWAADDIETTWDSPQQTLPFVQSMLSHLGPGASLINFGDIRPDTPANGSHVRVAPNTTWTDSDILAVTAAPRILVLPEMYGTYDVSLWTDFQKKYPNRIHYFGVLTECNSVDTQILQDITSDTLCGGEYNPKQAVEQMIAQMPQNGVAVVNNIRFEKDGLLDTAIPGSSNASQLVVRLNSADGKQYYVAQFPGWSYASCSGMAMAMVMNAYGKHVIAGDVLQAEYNLGVWDPTDGLHLLPMPNDAITQTAALPQFQFNASVSQTRTLSNILAIANGGEPVIVGIGHAPFVINGRMEDFSAGHYLVVTGGDSTHVFLADSSLADLTSISYSDFETLWTANPDNGRPTYSAVLTPK